MDLKQAKEYVDTKRINEHIEYSNNTISNEKISGKKVYILEHKINTLIRDVNRQRKVNRVIGYILLIFVMISLIQFYFLDTTSFIQLCFLAFSFMFLFSWGLLGF